MKDDLVSRKAALEAVKIPNGEYPNPSERHGIIIARVEARRRIMDTMFNNMDKLINRYPSGFSAERSIHRKE